MDKDLKILVYVAMVPKPNHDDPTRHRIFGRTLNSIMRLRWPGELHILFDRDDHPKIDNHYAHLAWRHNQIRDKMFREGYDAVLMVEADMIVPEDTLERLTAVDADVVYGLYCSRHNDHRWLVATELGMGSSKFLSYDRERAKASWGQVVPSVGVGMGCTLIYRHVFKKVKFRVVPGPGIGHGAADDWYFALDCQTAGFRQATDLGVVCGHITTHPAPMVIWPTIEDDDLYFLELLPGTVIHPLEPGDEVELKFNQHVPVMRLDKVRENGLPIHRHA